eukprot:SAG25_NODE_112_length_14924_cov_13.606476_5_plen_84_part_00
MNLLILSSEGALCHKHEEHQTDTPSWNLRVSRDRIICLGQATSMERSWVRYVATFRIHIEVGYCGQHELPTRRLRLQWHSLHS